MPFGDLSSFILLDETLAAVTAAYYQKTLESFSHGSYIDQNSPRRISPKDAGFALFEEQGNFSNLFDKNQSNSDSTGLFDFLKVLFFSADRTQVMSAAAKTIINEISNVYFGRNVNSRELVHLSPDAALAWSRNSGGKALFSPLALLEQQLGLEISDQAIGLMEDLPNNSVALLDSVNGQKHATNLGQILELLKSVEEKINAPASQSCEIFEKATQSDDGLQGYLGKATNGSCKPNGHGVIPSGPVRFCIQPTSKF